MDDLKNDTTRTTPMNKTELADAYGVCVRTFNRWMKPHAAKIGTPSGRFYTPAQVKIIFETFGEP